MAVATFHVPMQVGRQKKTQGPPISFEEPCRRKWENFKENPQSHGRKRGKDSSMTYFEKENVSSI